MATLWDIKGLEPHHSRASLGLDFSLVLSLECHVERIRDYSSWRPHINFTATSLFMEYFLFKTDGRFCVQVHKMTSKPSFWIFVLTAFLAALHMTTFFFKSRRFIDVWYTYEKDMYCRYILLSAFLQSEHTHCLCSRNRTSPILQKLLPCATSWSLPSKQNPNYNTIG